MMRCISVLAALTMASILPVSIDRNLDWTQVAGAGLARAVLSNDVSEFDYWLPVSGATQVWIEHPAIVSFGVDGGVSDFPRPPQPMGTTWLTPLMMAIYYDNQQFAARMISATTDFDVATPDGLTVFGLAMAWHREEVVAQLKAKGVSEEISSRKQWSPGSEFNLKTRKLPSRFLFKPNG